jgi:hypothetical protein
VLRERIQRVPVYWLGGVRCGIGVTLFQALFGNVGTCRLDVKGEVQVVNPTSMRVPMPSTGAEQPVVVMKRSDVAGLPRTPQLRVNYLTGGIYEQEKEIQQRIQA